MSLAAQSQIRKPLQVELLDDSVDLAPQLSSASTANIFIPISLLIVFQIIDALLTLKGLSVFGTHAEGNPILRIIIDMTSPVVGLASVKAAAIVVLFCLFNLLRKHPISWVPGAIWGINAVYLFGAIIPWTLLLV